MKPPLRCAAKPVGRSDMDRPRLMPLYPVEHQASFREGVPVSEELALAIRSLTTCLPQYVWKPDNHKVTIPVGALRSLERAARTVFGDG
jgi:hypothetical protein